MGARHATKIKEAKGSLNKHKPDYIEDEPQPNIVKFSPDAPDNLNEEGKKIWDEIVPKLVSLEIFSEIDKKIFASYCNEMGLYEKACSILEKSGYTTIAQSGYEMPSAYVAIKNQALKNAMAISKEFGLSPAARTKISVSKSQPKGIRASIQEKIK